MATAELNANRVEAIVKSDSVPSLPAVAIQLVKMCGDEAVDVNELADTLSLDPALASKVLKLANSPKYCRRKAISNIKRACMALGLKTLKIMSLSFSLTTAARIKRSESQFNFDMYWFHSICKAVVGRDLARLTKEPFEDEAFFCGLVGRIGQLFMANGDSESYNDVIASCSGDLPSAAEERAILGFDLHLVGSRVLKKWELPGDLVCAIEEWSKEESDSRLSRIVHLADIIATVICCESKGVACSVLYDKATKLFGLTSTEVDDFIVTLKEEVETLGGILDVDVPKDLEYAEVIDEARRQMIELTLETQLEVEDLRNRESTLRT
ncbi:MAG: HDOD domain-containing protein, partial [Planctomycetota bacterium]